MGIKYEQFLQWFTVFDFTTTKDIMEKLNLFSLYVKAYSHPYYNLKQLSLKNNETLFRDQIAFDYSFFISDVEKFEDGSDEQLEFFHENVSSDHLAPTAVFQNLCYMQTQMDKKLN